MAFLVPEELLPAIVPVVVYWIGSAFYSMLKIFMKEHRIFTKDEEDTKNLATKPHVLLVVLVNQLLHLTVFVIAFWVKNGKGDGNAAAAPPPTSVPRLVGQLCVAVLVLDLWQYIFHRLAHKSKFLYKHLHCYHHQLIVPYTFGAQYVHPMESLFGVTGSIAVASLASGMSAPTAAFFFSLVTLKSLDDHSGMWFPCSPISRFLSNNSALHALHHQHYGIKYNYSTFFLTSWDRLLGTYMPYSIEEKEGGGYLVRPATKDD